MPRRSDHIDQSERNEAAYQALHDAAHYDWAATTLFYAALHLVDAYHWPNRYKNHPKRKTSVATDPALAHISMHYEELYNRSQDARYDCVSFTAQQSSDLQSLDCAPSAAHIRSLLGL